MPNKTATLLCCGILAALCWSLADMLLVGFVPHPAHYPRLLALDTAMTGDTAFAALMQTASPARRFWGVVPATFSVAGYLIATAGLARLLEPARLSRVALALIFIGYALMPLAHAGFFYLGASAQTLIAVSDADVPLLVAQYNYFYQLLAVHWIAAITISACGWLLVAVQMARGRSILPRRLVLLTPLPLSLVLASPADVFPPRPWRRCSAVRRSTSRNCSSTAPHGDMLRAIAIHRKFQTRRAAEDSTRLYGEAAQHSMRLSVDGYIPPTPGGATRIVVHRKPHTVDGYKKEKAGFTRLVSSVAVTFVGY